MKGAAFFVVFMVMGAAVFAQAKPRLAILPFTGGNAEDAETIAEFFSFEEEINRVFTPVQRTTRAIESLMKEQQFQRSGLTDSDTIAELGRQLNADYVLAGHIATLGASKLLLITIVNVEELRQIAGDYREYQRIESVVDMLPDMAKRIAAAAARRASNLPRLAVLPFNTLSSGMNQGEAELLAQLLATELANSGRYAVFPRTKAIEKVLEEHHIERSGMTDPESRKAIGAAVNAQYVLSASVRKVGADNYFSASILHVEEASQTRGTREKYQTVSDGLRLMPKIAQSLLGGSDSAGPASGGAPSGFVFVPSGTFSMGSNNGDSDEKPVHQVTISKGFYMSDHEVTQREWAEVMGSNPSPSRFKGDALPVEQVSWHDAIEYCNQRSLKEGLTPAYSVSGDAITWNRNANGYRLPTEAEWEWAARGGGKGSMSYEYSGSDSVDAVAWYGGNSGSTTHPVKTKRANSLGLYDMSGNVYEWCWDWKDGYSAGAQTDSAGASSGTYRVWRGGSWYSNAKFVRVAFRSSNTPSYRGGDLGFRLVRP